jgi:hypothetical protein
MFPCLGEGKETLTMLGPVGRANLNHSSSDWSPKVSPSHHLKTETDTISETLFLVFGARGSVVVKALSYKTEGRGFDTR